MNALGLINISIGEEATVDGRRLQKFLGGFFFFFLLLYTNLLPITFDAGQSDLFTG